jgi:alpha-ketoglutarate-dependent taurine dioxygenase
MARIARELTITPIHPYFGARVEGVDLEETLDEPTFRRIFDAFQEHSVLVFGDQRLSDERQMAFSRRFGPLEATIKSVSQERGHGLAALRA